MVAMVAATFSQASFAQEKTAALSTILSEYYAIKDALVSGNAGLASAKANDFIKAAAEASNLTEASRAALVKDASSIAKTKELKKHREYFSAFSENMFELAKATRLSSDPVYKAFCPMVKASWLSNAPAIKNPYYGSSMLSCGKVVETLK